MLTREEVIEIASKENLLVNPSVVIVHHTDNLERFAQAIYRRGVEDAAKLAEELTLPDLYSQPCVDDLVVDIRKLMEE